MIEDLTRRITQLESRIIAIESILVEVRALVAQPHERLEALEAKFYELLKRVSWIEEQWLDDRAKTEKRLAEVERKIGARVLQVDN